MNDAREAAAAEYPEYCAGWRVATNPGKQDAFVRGAEWQAKRDAAQPAPVSDEEIQRRLNAPESEFVDADSVIAPAVTDEMVRAFWQSDYGDGVPFEALNESERNEIRHSIEAALRARLAT